MDPSRSRQPSGVTWVQLQDSSNEIFVARFETFDIPPKFERHRRVFLIKALLKLYENPAPGAFLDVLH